MMHLPEGLQNVSLRLGWKNRSKRTTDKETNQVKG